MFMACVFDYGMDIQQAVDAPRFHPELKGHHILSKGVGKTKKSQK